MGDGVCVMVQVTGQSIADKVETVSSLNTFGFSLSSLDVDGNKYNGQS